MAIQVNQNKKYYCKMSLMKVGIMQPYFFPYIGYFQLMNTVDEFVIYDNIKYTKKGWINRNRILVNGKDSYITIPLKIAKIKEKTAQILI